MKQFTAVKLIQKNGFISYAIKNIATGEFIQNHLGQLRHTLIFGTEERATEQTEYFNGNIK